MRLAILLLTSSLAVAQVPAADVKKDTPKPVQVKPQDLPKRVETLVENDAQKAIKAKSENAQLHLILDIKALEGLQEFKDYLTHRAQVDQFTKEYNAAATKPEKKEDPK